MFSCLCYLIVIINFVQVEVAQSTTSVAGNSSGWHRASTMMQETLREFVDPCEDFYKFACGNWGNVYGNNTKQLMLISEAIQSNLLQEISGIKESKNAMQEPYQKMKQFLESCRKRTLITDFSDVVAYLNTHGGWPIINRTWTLQKSQFERSIARLSHEILNAQNEEGSGAIVKIDVVWDAILNSTTIRITPGSFQSFTTNKTILEMANNLQKTGNRLYMLNVQQKIQDANSIVEFMKKLNEIYIEGVHEYRQNSTKLISLESLRKKFPSFAWDVFFRTQINDYHLKRIKKTAIIIVPSSLRKLLTLIKVTPPRTLANVVGFVFLTTAAKFYDGLGKNLPIPAYRRNPYHVQFITRTQQTFFKVNQCLHATSSVFHVATARLYLNRNLDTRIIAIANEMSQYIKDAQIQQTLKAEFLDPSSLKGAIEHLEDMKMYFSHPGWLLKDKDFADYHCNLEFSKDSNDFLGMIISVGRWKSDMKFDKLGLTQTLEDRIFTNTRITVTEAFYFYETNALVLSNAIMHYPLIDKEFPMAINYGSLGGIIGHEINHGFDPNSPRKWMTTDSRHICDRNVQCLIKQYDNVCFYNRSLCINGTFTVGDNFADNAGLVAAYYGYRNWLADNGPEAALPGLEQYTMDQIFFISFARPWCNSEQSTNETLKVILASDEHSPDSVRPTEALKNFDQFGKAFKCKIGSKMRPEKTCKLW